MKNRYVMSVSIIAMLSSFNAYSADLIIGRRHRSIPPAVEQSAAFQVQTSKELELKWSRRDSEMCPIMVQQMGNMRERYASQQCVAYELRILRDILNKGIEINMENKQAIMSIDGTQACSYAVNYGWKVLLADYHERVLPDVIEHFSCFSLCQKIKNAVAVGKFKISRPSSQNIRPSQHYLIEDVDIDLID